MSKIFFVPHKVENDFNGIMFFSQVLDECSEYEDIDVFFDFSKTVWFEANLTAIFAGLFEALKKNNCKISFMHVRSSIKSIFRKNGFYTHYKLGGEIDYYNSTIPFKRFEVNQEEEFTEYLNEEVLPKINLTLTQSQKRVFKTCLQEVFINAGQHATSDYVYTCGQYYHSNERVAFTIVDIGITIGHNVRKKLGELKDRDAINWATDFGNTTKVDNDGGIGLHLLKQHLAENGSLQIVSGNGYWEQNFGEVFHRNVSSDFQGTIVNIISDFSNKFK